MTSRLILLTLDIQIPKLWENEVVKEFPKLDLTLQSGSPVAHNSISGILKMNKKYFSNIQNFLIEKFPRTSLDIFYNQADLFHYFDANFPLSKILANSNCILNWPVKLQESGKKIRIILRENYVNSLLEEIEKKYKILNMSKVNIDFSFNEILTPKQKEILLPSLQLGYYKFPKQINLNQLSERLGISPSTLCVHLQKIESKIFNSDYSELFLRDLLLN